MKNKSARTGPRGTHSALGFTLVIAGFIGLFGGPHSLARAAGTIQELRVSVRGLVCAFCAQGLVKSVQKDAAVAKATVDLDEKQLHVYVKPGAELSRERLATLVQDAGFDVAQP